MSRPYPLALPFVLALTMALGPFSIDAYLPAFPAMAEALGVSIGEVARSLSIYVFGLAVGQLVGGPLSDHIGRARVMYAGLGIFIVACVGVSQAGSLETLLRWRAAQAFGGGWVMVLVPALVRDRVRGHDAAKLFSMIGLIMVVAPGVAPSIGSALLAVGSWRTVFQFLAVYALGLIPLITLFVLRSAAPKNSTPAPRESLLTRYRSVFTTTPALPFLFLQAFAFSVMMLFITHSSFIYQEHFGQSESVFALLFGANIVMMLLVNLANRAVLNRFTSRQILITCLSVQFVGVLLLAVMTWTGASVWLFLPAMMITVGAQGGVAPNNQACFMEFFERHGGTAASLLGAAQFGVAGLLSALSTLMPETLGSVIAAMFICSSICMMIVVRVLRPGRD
ncbi:Bcr/CflA family drug resistance efflux transporter [Alcanivorax sp. N3-2A]|nr:Bcr/CflA family drug resistance efflux transporter [Alcanivorax sp. N3-2A]|tara:strand:- start:47495 stop:48676 length:1182 start_codon:yes stop_codon:yes gene_type:complete